MGKLVQKILDAARKKQPVEELRRKAQKAKGRHSKNFWIQEEIDLADAEAREICQRMGWR